MYPDLYSKMDVFVSPSILEGGPVPILESMMSNCVPVASKTGFCPDIINHGQNGFLASSQEEWYESFMTLIESPELRDKMGLKGRKKVEN